MADQLWCSASMCTYTYEISLDPNSKLHCTKTIPLYYVYCISVASHDVTLIIFAILGVPAALMANRNQCPGRATPGSPGIVTV